jgi:parvulin-like peptidyl-prolyl isomerase
LLNNRFTHAAAAALLASALGVAGCNGNGATPPPTPDDVAATVNGVSIPVTKVDQVIDQQIKQAGPNAPQLTPVALAAARLQALDTLIQEEAMFQRAQRENLTPTDDEVKQELQSRIQKSNMSQDDYQKRLKDLGQTEDDLKNDIKHELAIKKLQDKVTATIPAPTEDEMKKFFDENRAQMTAPRGIQLADIIVDPANNGGGPEDAIGAEAAKAKAEAIANQLKGGADFATIARNRSEDPQSGMQGGQIGFFSDAQLKQTFPPDIAANLFALNTGQMTAPIQGQDGRWHLFLVQGKREQQQDMTYDQVKPQIAQTITQQRQQVVMSALLIDAVSSASIRNNLATQIIAHPDTFGALRPSPLTQPQAQQPAPQPTPQPEAQPGAPVNASNASNANTKAEPPPSNKKAEPPPSNKK